MTMKRDKPKETASSERPFRNTDLSSKAFIYFVVALCATPSSTNPMQSQHCPLRNWPELCNAFLKAVTVNRP